MYIPWAYFPPSLHPPCRTPLSRLWDLHRGLHRNLQAQQVDLVITFDGSSLTDSVEARAPICNEWRPDFERHGGDEREAS